ncbi:DinB family protein [Priestia endophytica]|uniref:DinB family protein n=1 Tax=Priestia endophytica TaxID=135735 RepID=UPI00227E37C9|nr:DinB family protein [Priestia endophytica]MCY8235334.1 DinB family protein [Priestia endophytica]
MAHSIIKLYDYHKWANSLILNRLKELPEEIYHQEIQSVFPSISKVVSHLCAGDQIGLDVFAGAPFDEAMKLYEQRFKEVEGKKLVDVEPLFDDLYARFDDFLKEKRDFDKSFPFNNPWIGDMEMSIAEMIQHIVNHGTYHRGNITAMLHQLGYTSVNMDYPRFLYQWKEKIQSH